MAATATLDWTGEGVSESHDGTKLRKTIQQRWTVIEAPERADVLAASGLPLFNAELTPGSPFRVRERRPQRSSGPSTWTVEIGYAIPENGTFGGDDDDPLAKPFRVLWGSRIKQVPKQMSAHNNRITDSAGVFFNPPPMAEIEVETLELRRYEAFYNRDKARTYRNKVNTNAFTLGSTNILVGECKCVYIGPASEFEIGAPYVEIVYRFEFDTESRAVANESGYPFQAHIIDRGVRGWYTKSGTNKLGWFCHKISDGGTDVCVQVESEPVLLDGTGKPISSEYYVTDRPDGTGEVFTPIANPNTGDHLAPQYASPFDDPTCRIWLYDVTGEVDFSAIFQ